MKPSILGAILGFGLASSSWGQSPPLPSSATSVAEKVEFESAPRPLGKLMEQRARARGEDPKPTPGDRLQGYLAKPQGRGPFPAVVVMHGCGPTPYVLETLPPLLASWGYVALSVDSLTTRKVEPNCTKDASSVDRASNSYGGLYYLASLPLVDRNRVGVLGISTGGDVVLSRGRHSRRLNGGQPGEPVVQGWRCILPTLRSLQRQDHVSPIDYDWAKRSVASRTGVRGTDSRPSK